MSIWSNLFKPRYTKYELVGTYSELVEITEQVEDTRFSHGYGISDPLDVKTVGTGKFVEIRYEVYKKIHIRTGLPKYKKIYLPE